MSLREQGGVDVLLSFATSEDLPDERTTLGPSNLEPIPLGRFNLLSQIRRTYDPDGIDELANSMEPSQDEGPDIDVLHNPVLARLTREQAIEYLNKINEVFSADHQIDGPDGLVPLGSEAGEHEGKYIVVIAGHRRTLAAVWKAMQLGKDPRGYNINSNVIEGENLTFSAAIAIQYKENFHRRPDSWEDAFAVDAIFQEGLENGRYTTFADCAKHLSINEDRVARAVRFQTLPEEARDSVKNKTLHFERALMLSRVFVAMALGACQHELEDDQKNQLARKLQLNKLYLPDVMQYVSKKKQKVLRSEFMDKLTEITEFRSHSEAALYTDNVVGSYLGDIVDLKLFLGSEADIENANDTVSRGLAREAAVRGLSTVVTALYGDLVRIEDGRPTVYGHSANVNNRVEALREVNNKIANLADAIEAAKNTGDRDESERAEAIAAGIEAGHELSLDIRHGHDLSDGAAHNNRIPQEQSIF